MEKLAQRQAEEPAMRGWGSRRRGDRACRQIPSSAPGRDVQLCDCIVEVAAAMFGIPTRELRSSSRAGADVARVRQIAMYVCHVVLGLNMREVGRGFGRDRTTVLHACHLVEDLRDDPDFERLIASLERVAAAILRAEASARW